jgi:hypothetical protein
MIGQMNLIEFLFNSIGQFPRSKFILLTFGPNVSFSLMFGRNLNLFKDYSIEEIGGEIQEKEIQEK